MRYNNWDSTMLQFSDVAPIFFIPSEDPENANDLNDIAAFKQNSNNQSSLTDSISTTSVSKSSDGYINKDIYVCTFCQVFSPQFAVVVDHIESCHGQSVPCGTKPENFVSKLKSLHGNVPKKSGKVGRPKKSKETRVEIQEPKQPVLEPTPGPQGLFWCKKCLRYFKKSRQLTQHICIDFEEQDSYSSESSIESEDGQEFRTYMDIDPVPWSRSKGKSNLQKCLSSSSLGSQLIIESNEEYKKMEENRTIPNWRNDPSYVPLFHDEKEKVAFEEHMKSIDYSCVDDLFQREEKRCRNNNKGNCVYVQSIIYSCNYCKKVLKSLSHIRLHCLTHTEFKPFTCPKCSYRTNSKGSLYMHMRKHTGNVFCCSQCDFKSIKRSHLLDHEATHSSVSHFCKLCKNMYKTLRSLIAHIRKYHNNPGGKRYLKSLSSKQAKEFKCDICKKKFKSSGMLNKHKQVCHESVQPCDGAQTEQTEVLSGYPAELNGVISDMQINSSNIIEDSSKDSQCDGILPKDPLAEIVLNNFLQQESSQSIMYENVFSQSSENILPPPDALLKNFQAEAISNQLSSEPSILEECQKTLDLDILNECLQSTNFPAPGFNIEPTIASEHPLQNNSENVENIGHLQEISEDKCEEPKPVEVKLFEKCRRAPAYECCVCSAIYICTSTLKAHLKEHVNSTLLEPPDEQFEEAKISETSSDLDKVCEILQDATESCSYDEELEKLYTSCLDTMWYLPEVSVVLQDDAALFNSVLDDISNFPISDI